MVIEVCVDTVASAIAAQSGGASRIELCGSLIEGGITPSAGLIKLTRSAVSLPLHVMIRPRGGDFCYEPDEFETMAKDVACAQKLGADGVVFGILTPNGTVDITRVRALVSQSRPLAITFHRAFDMTADLFRALDDVCSTGADRVLTSGGERTALLGSATIAQLVKHADNRIVIMAGSGIKPENARDFIEKTRVNEIHVGLRSSQPSPMLYQKQGISMGALQGREYERSVVLEEEVRKLRVSVSHLGIS